MTTEIAAPAHATLSPSGASRWMRCAPSLAMSVGVQDQSSVFADEGTAAHFLASECLEQGLAAVHFADQMITVWSDAVSHGRGTNWYERDTIPGTATIRHFGVDDEMAQNVQIYIDAIHSRMESFRLRGAVSVELLVEVRVEFSAFVKHPDQFGTSDVVLLIEWPDGGMQIDVNDLKYGRGVVVHAATFDLPPGIVDDDEGLKYVLNDCGAGNEQMMIYALGAYDQFSALGNYTVASWCIHQPRLGHVSEAECAIEALLAWATDVLAPAAERSLMYLESRGVPFSASDFTPGEKQCLFCKAKGTCAAAASHVFEAISADFTTLDEPIEPKIVDGVAQLGHLTAPQLGEVMTLVDFVEGWCTAVRAKTEAELLAGRAVPGFKLVQGKQGNRAWSDEEGATKMLKSFRLKQGQMFDYKLISPTSAEKLAPKPPKKGAAPAPADTPLSAKQWEKLQALISRAAGKPSVAPDSDKRDALVLTAPEAAFSNLDTGEDMA